MPRRTRSTASTKANADVHAPALGASAASIDPGRAATAKDLRPCLAARSSASGVAAMTPSTSPRGRAGRGRLRSRRLRGPATPQPSSATATLAFAAQRRKRRTFCEQRVGIGERIFRHRKLLEPTGDEQISAPPRREMLGRANDREQARRPHPTTKRGSSGPLSASSFAEVPAGAFSTMCENGTAATPRMPRSRMLARHS